MKTNNRFAKITSLALLVATLTIYGANRPGAAANAAPISAQEAATSPSTYIELGSIKLGRNQNALIIVVCASDPSGRDQRPVDVECTFYDWDGNVVATETKTILPGRATSLNLRDSLGGSQKTNELSPCVKILADPSDSRTKRVTATLQLTDDSGKVQSILCRKAGGRPDEY